MDTSRPPVERRHPPDALMRAVNPLVRWLLERGRLGNQLLVLHYTGRRTGRRFDVPAGYHSIDGVVSGVDQQRLAPQLHRRQRH
jgi:hypothetical protein